MKVKDMAQRAAGKTVIHGIVGAPLPVIARAFLSLRYTSATFFGPVKT